MIIASQNGPAKALQPHEAAILIDRITELEARIEKLEQPDHYWTEMMEYTSEDLHSVLDDEAADCGLEEGESCIVEVHLSRSLGIQNYKVTIKNGATTWEVSDE